MRKKANRNRHRIHISIDVKLLSKLDLLSKNIDLPKGRILETTIENIISKKIETSKSNTELCSVKRNRLNTTVNSKLLKKFNSYAESSNEKLNYLIEKELPKTIKHLTRKLNSCIYNK